MNLLSVSELKKEFDGETLFDGVSFSIEKGDKIGLVGVNGAGKTTLFKLLVGEEKPDGGEIYKAKELKIGYLSQHALSNSELCLYDELEQVFEPVKKIEKELSLLNKEIEKGENLQELIVKQENLMSKFEDLGGYSYKSMTVGTLIGLGFSEADFYRPVNTLSGGQRTRVCLAKLLLSDCNLLLLDEPTNHLDIASVMWLESFLSSRPQAVVVVSHDRYFLDKVTNITFDLEFTKLTVYKGNYSKFKEQKELLIKTKTRTYDNTIKEIKRLEASAKLLHSFNREKSVKRAESKEKAIDKLSQTLVKPETLNAEIKFSFSPVEQGGKEVIVAEKLSKSYGEKMLFSDLNFTLYRGEKAFILGGNGCGKTTLLKILLGIENAKGEREIGYRVTPAYYEQTLSNLNPEKDVLSEVWDEYPRLNDTEIRSALARFLFKGDDVYKSIKTLSGGEKARVVLLKILLKKANLLVLDEPTNHLDVYSREALEKALSEYTGTILCVSHDRYFINKLSTVIYEMEDGKLNKYDTCYENYLSIKKPIKIDNDNNASKEEYLSKKSYGKEKRKAENLLKKIEDEISLTENLLEEINKRLYGDEGRDYIKAQKLSEEAESLNLKLEDLMDKWEKASIEAEKYL